MPNPVAEPLGPDAKARLEDLLALLPAASVKSAWAIHDEAAGVYRELSELADDRLLPLAELACECVLKSLARLLELTPRWSSDPLEAAGATYLIADIKGEIAIWREVRDALPLPEAEADALQRDVDQQVAEHLHNALSADGAYVRAAVRVAYRRAGRRPARERPACPRRPRSRCHRRPRCSRGPPADDDDPEPDHARRWRSRWTPARGGMS